MTATTVTTTTLSRNDDDLTNLCHELKENIEMNNYRITGDVTHSLDEVHQWFDSQQNRNLTEHYTRILQDIHSAKENVVVSSYVYTLLHFQLLVILGIHKSD